jgi:hypothetical protein
VLSGGGFSPLHFWSAMALNAVYFSVALLIFRRVFDSARHRGLLVKLE